MIYIFSRHKVVDEIRLPCVAEREDGKSTDH